MKNLSNYPSNIDIFFLESDTNLPKNTVKIVKNTVYCGIDESYIPGILHKTLLAIKYLPTYDFYIRTNLSTIVDGNELNNFLLYKNENSWFSTGALIYNRKTDFLNSKEQKIINKTKNILYQKIKEKGLICHRFTGWFSGLSIIFSKPCANLLTKYLDNIPYIFELDIADDVMLGFLLGKHNPNIDHHVCVRENNKFYNDYSNIIFYRCKDIKKIDHDDLATSILKNPIIFGNIPIVIISYNSLTFTKNFVNQIKKLPNDIIIIDNNSQNTSLHIYYNQLEKELKYKVTIHRLTENIGNNVYITRKYLLPYVYILSNPYLELNLSIPTNISNILYNISNKHKKFKVGLSLDIDNFIQKNNNNQLESIKEYESQFLIKKIPDDDYIIYHDRIDTNFTLVNWKYYNNNNNNLYGIRIAGDFTYKYLPNIPDIEYKYMNEKSHNISNFKDTKTIAYVTGVFGNIKGDNIPSLPSQYNSYYVTNNTELAKNAQIKGWIPVIVNLREPDTEDITDKYIYWCTKSKYFKVFPQEYLQGKKYDFIVYFDNTFNVNVKNVNKHIQNWDIKNSVVFHKHPFLCCGADIELKESLKQDRYVRQKHLIYKYISDEVEKGYVINGERHFQCGFIIYNLNKPDTYIFQNMWMEHNKRCGIEDQVSLYFVAQRFPNSIGEFKYRIDTSTVN